MNYLIVKFQPTYVFKMRYYIRNYSNEVFVFFYCSLESANPLQAKIGWGFLCLSISYYRSPLQEIRCKFRAYYIVVVLIEKVENNIKVEDEKHFVVHCDKTKLFFTLINR